MVRSMHEKRNSDAASCTRYMILDQPMASPEVNFQSSSSCPPRYRQSCSLTQLGAALLERSGGLGTLQYSIFPEREVR